MMIHGNTCHAALPPTALRADHPLLAQAVLELDACCLEKLAILASPDFLTRVYSSIHSDSRPRKNKRPAKRISSLDGPLGLIAACSVTDSVLPDHNEPG